MYTGILILLIAYVLGSVPSALIVSRLFAGVDIRTLGDGNMGARNVSRTLGWKRGAIVALIDVGKGLLPVLLARASGLSLFWRIGAAFCAVLGHDFPIFAHFQGGQGLAATLGGLAALAPVEMVWGMMVYGTLFLITRHSDLSAGVGVGLTVLLMRLFHEPIELVVSSILLIVSVPAKMVLDRPRRMRIAEARNE